MPGTFSQIHIQTIFAVKGRESLIHYAWEEDLYKYITGIVHNKDQKMLAINGMPDHIHLLIGMRPSCCLSDLVREIKKSSTNFVNENKFAGQKFQWQEGYGTFSYGKSGLNKVIEYVRNQKEHHKMRTFREEYSGLLRKFEIDFKNEHLFDFME